MHLYFHDKELMHYNMFYTFLSLYQVVWLEALFASVSEWVEISTELTTSCPLKQKYFAFDTEDQ
jgi:hypothetical protein